VILGFEVRCIDLQDSALMRTIINGDPAHPGEIWKEVRNPYAS